MELLKDENNKNDPAWNDFILRNGGSFLQSYEWGEFQKSFGRKIWRIKKNNFESFLIGVDLAFKKKYIYCPRGPVFSDLGFSIENLNYFLEEAKKIAKSTRAVFLRIDPEILTGGRGEETLGGLGFVRSFKEVQPKTTLIVNLNNSPEDLLAAMRQKTRYNLRLSQKQKIGLLKINYKSEDFKERFECFWSLLKKTTKRDGFRPHPKEYYEKIFEFFPNSVLFCAKSDGKIIASNIVIFWGDRATYLHGAADYEFRNLMAPYFLHWEQILEAKKRGCKEYDFWGIDEKKWPTLTRFKRGFGGMEAKYIGVWDFVFDKNKYIIYKLMSILKRTLR